MYAIIRTGGKQYKVSIDDKLEVEKLDIEAGQDIILDDILMVSDGKKTTIGAPLVKGATVIAEIIEQKRDKKVVIFKKKKRQNYRRKKGHKQPLTVIKIKEIKTA